MARGPHSRWKGCALCKPHKDRRLGFAQQWDGGRFPARVLRQMGGRTRRLQRRDIRDAVEA